MTAHIDFDTIHNDDLDDDDLDRTSGAKASFSYNK